MQQGHIFATRAQLQVQNPGWRGTRLTCGNLGPSPHCAALRWLAGWVLHRECLYRLIASHRPPVYQTVRSITP